MRLSELVGTEVVTTGGERLGRVHDLLLVQDGPLGAGGMASLRLHALAVDRRAVGSRLGYFQGTVDGPWLLKVLFGRKPVLIPWAAIVKRSADRIVVDPARMADSGVG